MLAALATQNTFLVEIGSRDANTIGLVALPLVNSIHRLRPLSKGPQTVVSRL